VPSRAGTAGPSGGDPSSPEDRHGEDQARSPPRTGHAQSVISSSSGAARRSPTASPKPRSSGRLSLENHAAKEPGPRTGAGLPLPGGRAALAGTVRDQVPRVGVDLIVIEGIVHGDSQGKGKSIAFRLDGNGNRHSSEPTRDMTRGSGRRVPKARGAGLSSCSIGLPASRMAHAFTSCWSLGSLGTISHHQSSIAVQTNLSDCSD